MPATGPVRAMILWFPDWPVTAARATQGLPPDGPVALIDRGLVIACSPEARHEGVRRGLRVREAQLRCPGLTLCPYDPLADARAFEPVAQVIEHVIPGVQVVRPGLCALRARGAARYYGGEDRAAERLFAELKQHGWPPSGAGVADSRFAAEQAAYRTTARCRVLVVPPGESPAFLGPLPIETLGEPELTPLLRRLGAGTLADFATLAATDVRTRFGETGARAHERASGLDPRPVTARVPPRDLDSSTEFEPPLDRVDQVAFGLRTAAERFIAGLTTEGLVCTGIRVAVTGETGTVSEREWAHPRYFTAADVLDRVRWQLQGSGGIDAGLTSSIARVRISPGRVDAIGNHEEGLWGQGADERVHHGLSRIQSMLGHEAVLTAVPGGGRLLAERRALVAWGDAPPASARATADRPWPGSLPDPAPATVYASPRPALVLDERGESVDVDRRGALSAPPAWFSPTPPGDRRLRVQDWAGPWPVMERWWDPARARRIDRLQLVDERGEAWLLLLERHRWWLEARYD